MNDLTTGLEEAKSMQDTLQAAVEADKKEENLKVTKQVKNIDYKLHAEGEMHGHVLSLDCGFSKCPTHKRYYARVFWKLDTFALRH